MHQAISIDRRRAVLLLIDLQEEQRVDPLYRVAGFDLLIGNAQALLQAARNSGMRVVHSAYRRDFDLCPPRPFEPRGEGGSAAFSDKTSALTELCAEVAPLAGEMVIVKNDASVFSEGAMREATAKTEWLIVAGVWTEACVAATVRDAMAAGLRVLIVKDACGSGTAAMHQTGVVNLANRLYGGAVADTERTLRLLAGDAADVWVAERPAPILFTYEDASRHYDSL